MSALDKIPPEVAELALEGAEALARFIAKKLGLDDEAEAVERIKRSMLDAAWSEGAAIGTELGIALADLAHGADDVLQAMREAHKGIPGVEPPPSELFDTSDEKKP